MNALSDAFTTEGVVVSVEARDWLRDDTSTSALEDLHPFFSSVHIFGEGDKLLIIMFKACVTFVGLLALSSAATYQYDAEGSVAYSTADPVSVAMDVDGCSSTKMCTMDLAITQPTDGKKAPFAVFTNGFDLTDDEYASYANRLASWGWAVARWNVPESPFSYNSHATRARLAVSVIDWAEKNLDVDTSAVYMVGHSAGGKSSVLAAEYDNRVKAVFGIDPVNCSPPGKSVSDDNPDATVNMAALEGRVSLAWIGSELGAEKMLGQACAPGDCNYMTFYNATMGDSWAVTQLDVGHMQFLDNRSGAGMAAKFCKSGKTDDAVAIAAAQTMMVSWGQYVVNGDRSVVADYVTGGWSADMVSQGVLTSETKGF